MRTIIWIVIIVFAAYQVMSLPRFRDNFACPLLKCQGIDPECAQPTYYRQKGRVCRGCDRNICLSTNLPVK
ncbi:hypothetical protein CHS0354_037940 [Potamilus streckersoni]|uniref:Uncharacterized protein n=1 Tax=Potamilus streckersoni TaxID=2493646 RepID=A0AAE0T9K0_9BIVA|nr:hypothetical protein CHS0354_037940 [Potamilus streckersoni]